MIADNGQGMDQAALREAMRFGSRHDKTAEQLGKYGIGLKAASLSQADSVTVITRTAKSKTCHGSRWLLNNVKADWKVEILDSRGACEAIAPGCGPVTFARSGTMVVWEKLEHLQALPNLVERVLQKTTAELHVELGVRFHRFIERGKLEITTDQLKLGSAPSTVHVPIKALDPFSYEASGHAQYPRRISLNVDGKKVPLVCHIWPPKSKAPGYRLGGGKVASRQGFYFYRNDRLIQAGGWNGLRSEQSEPHLSLARVAVEVPSSLDSVFKLQVTKMGLQPTPEFAKALFEAASDGYSAVFERFLADAQSVYRKQKAAEKERFLAVPSDGFSAPALKAMVSVIAPAKKHKKETVKFKWAKLDPYEMFRLGKKPLRIELNVAYRKQVAHNGTNDAPMLKVALLLLLQEHLLKAYSKDGVEKWLRQVNEVMIASLKK
jgi:hypothetical protein